MHARRRELERHLLNDRDDVDAWRVYLDLLIDEGEPTGELAALQAANRPGLAQNHLFKHREWFFGSLWPSVRDGLITIEWRHGHVVAATIPPSEEQAEVALDFMSLPVARFLDGLALHAVDPRTIAALDADPWPLRTLRWLPGRLEQRRSAPLPTWPWLETLDAPEFELSPGEHRSLRHLLARSAKPGAWSLPALESLQLAEFAGLRALLAAGVTPRELHFLEEGADAAVEALVASAAVEALVASAAAATIARLAVRGLTEAGARRLLDARSVMPALERVLPGRFAGNRAVLEELQRSLR